MKMNCASPVTRFAISQHRAGSFAAEEHQSRRPIRIEPEFLPLGCPVDRRATIEIRPQNHPRSQKHALRRMTKRRGLFGCLACAANEILLLAFDPEMRRIIGQIGEDGHERSRRQTLPQRTIEIRNQRHHQIALALRPEFLEQPDLPAMVQADQPMHEHRQLRRSQRPAFLQQQVVNVLHPNAGVLAEDVQRVQNLLEIDQPDLPRPLLFFNNGL